MPFLLLLVLTLTCLPREWPAPAEALGRPGSAALVWLVMALFAAVGWWAASWWRRELRRAPECRARVLRRFGQFRRWHVYFLLAAYFLLVCFGGWGWLVTDHLVQNQLVLPGTNFVMLAPLFAGLVLSWAGYHSLEKALSDSAPLPPAEPFPGLFGHVGLQCRHNFLLVAPPLVLMLLQQTVLALFPGLLDNQLVLPVIGMGLLAAMYAGVPWVLRLLLGLKPLPPGPLRDRLLATARRLNFRFNDILIWNTRHTIVNGMVTGPLPILRYVVLTDRLILELAPEEVEAVFGHEVGHIKHHHLLFYFGFLLASLIAVVGLWDVLSKLLSQESVQAWFTENLPLAQEWLQAYELLSALPLLGLLGIYIVVVFGYVSRRCERQADIYGCRTVSVPVFVEALEKVARLNGISRDRPGWLMSWQHSTIALRVEFLQKMDADPALEPWFQRRVGLVKWGMLLGLTAVLVTLVALWPNDMWAVLFNLGY
jgi:Zn-dependent protease with chaperone function